MLSVLCDIPIFSTENKLAYIGQLGTLLNLQIWFWEMTLNIGKVTCILCFAELITIN